MSEKITFLLFESPKQQKTLAKYKSESFRKAAMKAASQGHTDIYLRISNTLKCAHYEGFNVKLETPCVTTINGREITFSKKAGCKYICKFVLNE
jgi:hypothetical protein